MLLSSSGPVVFRGDVSDFFGADFSKFSSIFFQISVDRFFFLLCFYFSIMLLSSGVTTTELGWTQSRGSRGLREDVSDFLGADFSKFSLIFSKILVDRIFFLLCLYPVA